ncbi:MAG: type II secretion system protein GspD [Haliea sp.]|uniref:type II secretion system secretin GspD n=1 Tax=Haliea sp. TaxID=1932666 RepID=UPI000C5AA695|nr:type II secretion system secretin GspD [Haliea sp.]MBM69883.1 type II secretion system protein GspD [Haliea sp.]|tara:strand:+ start:111758 stop:113965 length:2208 start_codon:yes stop_codon:yes gene_type:complete
MLRRFSRLLVLVPLLTSCALLDNQYRGEPTEPSAGAPAAAAQEPALSRSAGELAESAEERVKPVIYRGSDQQVRIPGKRDAVRLVGDAVSLNFEDAPLSEVVHAVLGDILGLDYILDGPVAGTITLRSRTPIPRDQLLTILESLLSANQMVMVRDSQDRYLVTGAQQASRQAPRLSNPRDPGAGYSTVVVPLQYISASNMAEILRPVADEQAFLRIDNTRNLLLLAGTRMQIDGWLDMVDTFDVDLLKGMSVGLFTLEHSRVGETATVLQGMLRTGGNGDEEVGQLVKIIPIERLNSLLVVTPRSHYLDTLGTWIERLDSRPDSKFEKRLFVYPVQNTTASRLAELISNIYAGGASATGGVAGTGGGYSADREVAPGLSMESIGSASGGASGSGSGSFGSSANSAGDSAGFSADFGSAPGTSSSAATLGGEEGQGVADVRVVADEENNALMIYATGKQYDLIKDALRQLDVIATQVIIEASILEVSLTDELRYGLEWTFKNGLGSDYDGFGQLGNSAGGPSATSPGFSYTVTNSLGDISAVLNALSEDSLINVISSPSVMVLDNHPAYIHVGDQVPVRQGTSSTDGGTVTENIVYRDTGVKLMVRPSVNAGQLVTMDVEQSVTDVGNVDSATGQRTFLERNIMSRVAVRSNESVVLGGLIRENATATDSGVPLLHRMPVLGALFGTTSESNRRTELLVIITPRVINNEQELRDVSRELRSRVRNMELISAPLVAE